MDRMKKLGERVRGKGNVPSYPLFILDPFPFPLSPFPHVFVLSILV